MTPIDIRPADLATVRRILREHVPALEVRAFGSRVAWNARETSDLDLALMTDEPLSIDRTAKLRAAFTDSDLPCRVDIVDWAAASESFREQIRLQSTPVVGAVDLSRIEHRVETAAPWVRHDVHDLIRDGVLVVGDGYRAKNSELSASGLPFARAGNIAGGFRFSGADRFPEDGLHKVGDKTSRPGDVVFTSKGTVGRFAFVRADTDHFVYSPQLCFWRPMDRKAIDPYFLYCWMRGPEFFGQFKAVASQTDMAEYVSLTDQRRMFITLPPLDEQRVIGHIVGTLDDKIELNRRMNATLEAMARALFRSWFVDFDPVRAKMEGRDTGLPSRVADLFPDRLVVSKLGDTPEGWTVGTLGDVAEPSGTGVNPTSVAQDTPYIGLEHMPRHSVALTDWGLAGSVSSNKSSFSKGDVLFGKLRPYFHKVGIAPLNGVCSTDIVVLTARMPDLSAFVLACVSSPEFISYTNQTSTGTKMPRTNWRSMSRYEVCRPAEPIAEAFQGVAGPMLERIVANIRESRTLGALRDALLPKLVSGERRVRDAERVVGP